MAEMVNGIKDTVDITGIAKVDMKQHKNTCFSSYLQFLLNKSRSSCTYLWKL